jgi:hypothetical protein
MTTIKNSGFQIDVSFRNFLFMRGQAVKDTRDVLTELITNSVDAYRKLDGYETLTKIIYIVFYYHTNTITGGKEYYLSVTDNAIGVSSGNMKSCFLEAGNLTSSKNSRGFFSTGAKNITIMGDIYYTSIKDGILSQIYLDDQAYGHIVTSGPISTDLTTVPDIVGIQTENIHRDIFNIPLNGLNCTLAYTNPNEMDKFNTIGSVVDMLESISKIATLRDIMTDPTYNIMVDIRSCTPYIDILNPNNYVPPIIHTDYALYNPIHQSDNFGGRYISRLQYTYPDADLLLSITFNVPKFEQYQCKFVIYKALKPIEQPLFDNQLEFGFLIKDDCAIHEVNTLGVNDRYRWNPNMNYLYGYVLCDGFHEELMRYDAGLTTDLIIDPNRIGGINKTHPLYQGILTVCLPRLDKIIIEVQNQTTFKTINIDELDTIVNKLEDMGVTIFNNNNVTFNFTPDNASNIALAIKGTENTIVQEITGSNNLRILQEDSPTIEQIKLMESNNTNNVMYAYYVDPQTDELQQITLDIPENLNNIQRDDQIMQGIIDGLEQKGITMPTVYRFIDGNVQKIEIYKKGSINRKINDDTETIQIPHKSLTIQFINDINYQQKYIIDTTNGVAIKINLHNPIVADKMSKTKIDNANSYDFKISDEASYDALNFLSTLICTAFTDIVVSNDIQTGKVSTSGDGINAANGIIDYWNTIETKIEVMIHDLFTGFINNKKVQMQNNIIQNVTNAKMQILDLVMSGNATLEEIERGANMLIVSMQSSFMGIGTTP